MTTVIIWENNMLAGGREAINPRTQKVVHWPGHASLLIDDVWVNRYDDSSATYVSWWPGMKIAEAKNTIGFRMESATAGMKVAMGKPKTNFVGDMTSEGYLPDHIIRLKTTANQQRDMQAKWASIREKEGAHYRALYKNCGTIVARVMRAGNISAGKTAFWYEHALVWTPNKVKDYAMAAGGAPVKWDALFAEMNAAGVTYSDWGGKKTGRDKRYSSCGVACDR